MALTDAQRSELASLEDRVAKMRVLREVLGDGYVAHRVTLQQLKLADELLSALVDDVVRYRVVHGV